MPGVCATIQLDTGSYASLDESRPGYAWLGGSKREAADAMRAKTARCVRHSVPPAAGELCAQDIDGCGRAYRVTAARMSRGQGAVTLQVAPI